MAQTIRALAAKPNLPEFNPKTRCVGKQEPILVSCSLTHLYMYIGTCKYLNMSMSMHIHKRNNDIEKVVS